MTLSFCRCLGATIFLGMLCFAAAASAQGQSPATTREDLVAKLAGKRIRVDQSTGQLRAITEGEARDLITAVLQATDASQPEPQAAIRSAAGAMVRLGEHVGHIVVVRPGEDGQLAVRCVGSADEAVTFLAEEDLLPLQ